VRISQEIILYFVLKKELYSQEKTFFVSMKKSGFNVALLIGCILLCEMAGILGSIFTVSQIPSWYAFLEKPFFTPPNWLFAPVWTILYAFLGVCLFLLLRAEKTRERKNALRFFFLQLVLNAFWSPLFFGAHQLFLGLLLLLCIWISTCVTMFFSYRVSKFAFYLLIPYILWLSFAGVLNASLWILNA
jgi:translocator protein